MSTNVEVNNDHHKLCIYHGVCHRSGFKIVHHWHLNDDHVVHSNNSLITGRSRKGRTENKLFFADFSLIAIGLPLFLKKYLLIL